MIWSNHMSRVAIGLTATVPDEIIEANIGYLPWVLGDSLAAQVQPHVAAAHLGYFPALAYFREEGRGVDPALLALIDEVAQFSVDYARRELRRRLSRVFSGIQIDQAQCLAYTLPRARPGQPFAAAELGKHYAPAKVKLELVLSTLERTPVSEPERLAVSKVEHWAREPFACLEILAAHTLPLPDRDGAA